MQIYRKRNPPTKEQIVALLDEGLSVVEAARRLGYSKSAFCTLYRRMERLGISLPGSVQDQLRRTESISPIQHEFIVGTLLGDGSIPPLRNRYRNHHLQFSHTSKLSDYMRWKADFMAPLGRKITPVTVGTHNALFFQTITHTDFAAYRSLFYPDGIKVVPPNIGELLTPLALAVWYMDDGHYRRWHTNRGGYCTFCSESFTVAEHEHLARVLTERYALPTRFQRVASGSGLRLMFDRETSEQFAQLIRPFVHPLLLYKLP